MYSNNKGIAEENKIVIKLLSILKKTGTLQ